VGKINSIKVVDYKAKAGHHFSNFSVGCCLDENSEDLSSINFLAFDQVPMELLDSKN
jgi:hypothetical protein